MRAETNCTLWEFRGAHLAKMLRHSPSFLPPLCRSYLQASPVPTSWWLPPLRCRCPDLPLSTGVGGPPQSTLGCCIPSR